jgi:hypothetical protein
MQGVVINWLNKIIQREKIKEEKFPEQLLDRLKNGPSNDNMIVARAIATNNRLSKWVVIYQRQTNDIKDQYFKLRYTIHEFELPNESTNFDQTEKLNKRTWYVRKEEEIYELLFRIGIHPNNFGLPSMSNYPFKVDKVA